MMDPNSGKAVVRTLRLVLSMHLLVALHAPVALADGPGLLCSDLNPAAPTETRKVKNKIIYQEVVDGIFPGALFPLAYAIDHEVTPTWLYYDDHGRVMSAKAAIAILQNHPASQDAIAAWRGDTQAQSQARMEVVGGVVGVAVGDPGTAASSADRTGAALENLDRLEGGPETAFAEAVCAFNASQAARRARLGGAR